MLLMSFASFSFKEYGKTRGNCDIFLPVKVFLLQVYENLNRMCYGLIKVEFWSSKKVVFISANDIHLRMMKNAFYFISKGLFFLETFTFLSWVFDCVEKQFDKKYMINFELGVTDWITSKYSNTYHPISKKKRKPDNEICSDNGIQNEKYFSSNFSHKRWWRSYSQTLL